MRCNCVEGEVLAVAIAVLAVEREYEVGEEDI